MMVSYPKQKQAIKQQVHLCQITNDKTLLNEIYQTEQMLIIKERMRERINVIAHQYLFEIINNFQYNQYLQNNAIFQQSFIALSILKFYLQFTNNIAIILFYQTSTIIKAQIQIYFSLQSTSKTTNNLSTNQKTQKIQTNKQQLQQPHQYRYKSQQFKQNSIIQIKLHLLQFIRDAVRNNQQASKVMIVYMVGIQCTFSMALWFRTNIIQYIYYCQQKINFMNEYQENMIGIDVFGCLTLRKTFSFNDDSLQFPYFQDDQEQISNINQPSIHKALSTTCPSREIELQPEAIIEQIDTKPGYLLFQSESQTKEKHDSVFRGEKDDTVQLNINFKTILFNYFKELVLMRELTQYQNKLVFQFGFRSPSFKSFMLFLENTEQNSSIRDHALKLIESHLIIKRIMRSRCKMNTKLQMIKFVQILRVNLRRGNTFIRWKHMHKK